MYISLEFIYLGTLTSASAHIITAVIGSGVLSLAWAIAQLGWIAGPAVLLMFSLVTYFTSNLLADSYRTPDPVYGKRNYTYMDVVQANLGGIKVKLCGMAQYANLVGTTIGYTITASISIVAVKKSNCYHYNGHNEDCKSIYYQYMIMFGAIQIVLSQIQNFHKLSWLSMVATVMSIAYSTIGIGLSIAKVATRKHVRTSLTGVTVGVDVTGQEKIWRTFQAIGDIAFSYTYSPILIEIQDTLKSYPPENNVMKKASLIGVSTTTMFYALCGCVGYAAFGNNAPGNFLTSFGFYEPFWLIDFANVCIVIHLIGAYQVFAQPIFAFVEMKCKQRWATSKFIMKEHSITIPFYGGYNINMLRLFWRTSYVIMTTVIAMIFPFFNSFLGLIGAISFYPLTVYFPIEMHLARSNIRKFSSTWLWLKMLSFTCFVVALVAGIGSVQGLLHELKKYQVFEAE
ncbi:amino acid permease 6-like protein [Tanacetum coccineum]